MSLELFSKMMSSLFTVMRTVIVMPWPFALHLSQSVDCQSERSRVFFEFHSRQAENDGEIFPGPRRLLPSTRVPLLVSNFFESSTSRLPRSCPLWPSTSRVVFHRNSWNGSSRMGEMQRQLCLSYIQRSFGVSSWTNSAHNNNCLHEMWKWALPLIARPSAGTNLQ